MACLASMLIRDDLSVLDRSFMTGVYIGTSLFLVFLIGLIYSVLIVERHITAILTTKWPFTTLLLSKLNPLNFPYGRMAFDSYFNV